MNLPLPHHRRAPLIPAKRGPRIDERRNAPGDEVTLAGWFALAYGLGMFALLMGVLRGIGA